MSELVQLYDYCDVGLKIKTNKGRIRYENWIKKERDRIASRKGRVAQIRTRESDQTKLYDVNGKYAGIRKKASVEIALFVNDVSRLDTSEIKHINIMELM